MSRRKNLTIFHVILLASCFQITLTNLTWISMDVNESPGGVGPVAVLIRKDKERDREYISSLLTTESTGPSSSSETVADGNPDELLSINTTDASPSLFYSASSAENGTYLTPLTGNNNSVVVTVNTSSSTGGYGYRLNSSVSNSSPSPTYLTSLNSSNQVPGGIEHRFRWIDNRNRPAPPPRQPPLHGIPSGFRNPVSSSTYPSPVMVQQAPLIHTPSFGGSSINPVGFAGSVPSSVSSSFYPNSNGMARKPNINLTRVEHISAECSDDYMKVVTAFNGTFNGLVYSAGYVHDPNCIYVNGTGRNRYEFFIRLNQCGTLGRQEMYMPKKAGDVRRRDNLMWNTLSIQYNPLIEEEFDEHYRVTCEYGSDFWKTVTFPLINVEVNTGSPVVFTINPPQCQMEIRRGFGVAGTRTSGPVTVGDPLTLLIHMKSEKAGFDILVKNCIAHNGGAQRLQLIDTNGCVTNEKLISPFRGTYNADDGSQVTLYAFLKAFRFTGSPALYLECDIHMCHNKCPPQRCYWRNLSKRDLSSVLERNSSDAKDPVISESISLFQALEVRHDGDTDSSDQREARYRAEIDLDSGICLPVNRVALFICIFCLTTLTSISITVCSTLKLRRLRKDQRCVNDRFPYKSSSCSPSPTLRSLSPRY